MVENAEEGKTHYPYCRQPTEHGTSLRYVADARSDRVAKKLHDFLKDDHLHEG